MIAHPDLIPLDFQVFDYAKCFDTRSSHTAIDYPISYQQLHILLAEQVECSFIQCVHEHV